MVVVSHGGTSENTGLTAAEGISQSPRDRGAGPTHVLQELLPEGKSPKPTRDQAGEMKVA